MSYQVIVTALSGKGKKIYSFPDVVDESDFPEGVADELYKKGFIRKMDEKPKTEPPKIESPKQFDEITKKEILSWLNKKGVEYSPSDNKKKVYELYVGNF